MRIPKKRQPLRNSAPGTAPGTLTPPADAQATKITAIGFSGEAIHEQPIGDPAEIAALQRDWPVVWVNVEGLGTPDLIDRLGKALNLHPLALEDVLSQKQRPKVDAYDSNLFVIAEAARCHDLDFEPEQVGLFIGANFVVTMDDRPLEAFRPVLERLRAGRMKRAYFLHPDYLAYSLIDSMVDEFFPLLDRFSDRLDALEEEVVARPSRQLIADTHMIKRELQQIRHGIWPMREMLNNFATQTAFMHEETKPYLRDCYDHVIQIVDIVETYRERASGLVDIYLSSMTNRTNEIMRVLTIIATIFMPLSFIASVYGMNFDTGSPYNMPELHWRYGYPYALGLMAAVALLMLLWFWRKGWFTPAEKFNPPGPQPSRSE